MMKKLKFNLKSAANTYGPEKVYESPPQIKASPASIVNAVADVIAPVIKMKKRRRLKKNKKNKIVDDSNWIRTDDEWLNEKYAKYSGLTRQSKKARYLIALKARNASIFRFAKRALKLSKKINNKFIKKLKLKIGKI
jgi:hypothetical protein